MSALGPGAYSSAVWARFCAPRHALAEQAERSACVQSAAHQLELCMHWGGAGYAFSAVGCPTTIAAADYCAETLNAGRQPSAAEIMDALEIGDDHRHCVLLCEDVVTALMAEFAKVPSLYDQ